MQFESRDKVLRRNRLIQRFSLFRGQSSADNRKQLAYIYAISMRTGFISLLFVALSASPAAVCGQSTGELHVWVESHGSVPPIPEWFGCVSDLKHKSYDREKAKACLDSILLHFEIFKGQASLHRYKQKDELTFHLKSPPVIVTDVDLGIAPADLAKVHELLAINGTALRPGVVYEYRGEASSALVLDLLLRSSGRRAGISRTVRLDYKRNLAQVEFKIWEGPDTHPEPLVPPYAEPCKITNGYFSWIDADDFSPVSFVERQMKTRWAGCFSEADLHDDLVMLKSMKFLKEGDISVKGSGGDRSMSVHLRGNPIPIEQIRVKGYGLLGALATSDIPPLAINVGDTYSHSAARNVARELKKTFMREDRQVKVFTDVEITSDGKANLEFGVLAYPNDVVWVNGAKFNGSFPDSLDLVDY